MPEELAASRDQGRGSTEPPMPLPRNTTWTHFYSGSSRWCLNRDTVRFIVSYYRSTESRRLRRYLPLSANSNRIFFQTAILNSGHKAQCTKFDEAKSQEIFDGAREPMPDEKAGVFHYIDWSPEREDPATLDESDFHRLKESGQFFACKLVDHKSLGLVRLIEREILGVTPEIVGGNPISSWTSRIDKGADLMRSDFRVVALVAAYNEADIISQTVLI